MLQNSNTIQPKVVVIRRRPNQGFGFTLRHFIAYPPEDDPSWPAQEVSDPSYQVKAMETIFIKEVQPNGPAHYANLQTGDRVLMVNNTPIAGIAYTAIVSMIKTTPSVLTLHVVPKECDVLQMHYTSIAHTPESNRLSTAVTATGSGPNTGGSTGGQRSMPPPPLNVVGNSNAAGALIPIAAKTFPQQLISYSAPAVPVALGHGSRSGSITNTNNTISGGSARPIIGVGGGGGGVGGGANSFDFDDITTQNLHHSTLLMRGDGAYMRSQPPNLAVLSSRQQLQHQHQQPHPNSTFYSSTAIDTSDLMIRLRESIKQKEEFLKSPVPHALQQQHQQQQQQQQQQSAHSQHFFPHTPPSGSPQLSMVSTSTTSIGSSGLSSTPTGARGQVRAFAKQPLSATSSASSTRELLPAGCDMQNYYLKSTTTSSSSSSHFNDGVTLSRAGGSDIMKSSSLVTSVARNQPIRQTALTGNTNGNAGVGVGIGIGVGVGAGGSNSNGSSNVSALRDKYNSKDYDYLETLQETGVTNKVFERKLVSHMAKGFDPFKPLSINTNNVIHESTSAPGNVVMMKKPGVLYDSLQHHPLHQLQIQQLQQHQIPQPKLHHSSIIDSQQGSRMEIHKATLATATIDHTPSISNKYGNNKLPEVVVEKSITTAAATTTTGATTTITTTSKTLADIAENNDVPHSKAPTAASAPGATNEVNVVRRFRPMSSFDDSKPMRRTSYLRATNNENDFQTDSPPSKGIVCDIPDSVTGCSGSSLSKDNAGNSVEDSDLDPTYEVVGGGSNNTVDVTSTSEEDKASAVAATNEMTEGSGSRRASNNSDIRISVHLDNVSNDFNGKSDTKEMATEMEVFETEMEIKSSCINGKRLSEYRSWRLVKIEIKGDILKIHPSRNSKSDANVIELDIRNFRIFDESTDKKKFVFRIQSKPVILHSTYLGPDQNLEDDKLTSSTSSASTTAMEQSQHQQHTNTEILFKTKSLNEMKRIFGLLQWKNSLIFEDSDLQGKQLAEPQKTAAIAIMPTTTYCDENVQPQHQHQQLLQADYSPLSTTSRGGVGGDMEASASASDSISPVMKTRKSASQKNIPDKDLGSPKSLNWKLLFRRGGGGGGGGAGGGSGGSHSSADISPSNLSSHSKTVGSIGVPLKLCPMSSSNEYVPQLVEVCTNIVETKGLSVVGIYRIPGNKAAISELSDQVKKPDFNWERCNTDVRWEDVNVVSSLLKLFIRSLPDALLPSSFYNPFIEADKKTGMLRLKELNKLLMSLPQYSYETLKHLIRHLNRVSKNCDVNLMEPKNLAIIFGPSIIRTPNDTLEIAVKDMKHQCRIVELLVTQYDYFFENGATPDIADVSGNLPITCASDIVSDEAQSQQKQTNMLLHNVSKIERLAEREPTSRTSRFIPQLRRRAHGKRSSDTYSGESVSSIDYTKSSGSITHTISNSSSTNVTNISSSSSNSAHMVNNNTTTKSSSTTTLSTLKKKERGFLSHHSRSHHRKASLDEKDSGSGSGSGSGDSLRKEQQRSSVDISTLLTDDESSNSHISDTGSMSLTTITDTLDTKLHNLRNGSLSNDENGSPDFPKNRRHTLGQPLHLPTENIPYADESPERHFYNACPLDAPNTLMLSRSCTAANMIGKSTGELHPKPKEFRVPLTLASTHSTHSTHKSNKLQHSATAPISCISAAVASNSNTPASTVNTPTAVLTVKTTTIAPSAGIGGIAGAASNIGNNARNSYTTNRNLRFSSSVYNQGGSEDDSEGSTTSDPKEATFIASPSFFPERYNKKRRDHRLFRSASFNCRNYSTRHGVNGGGNSMCASSLTKDEKTDMNLTKKRQIQNKQNRSIKRRHTVGGPHDYSSPAAGNNCNHHCNKTTTAASGGNTTTTTTTTVLRRIPIPSANANISNNNNSHSNINNNLQQCDGSNGNNSGVGGNAGDTTVAVAGGGVGVGVGAGEHVLEVGIRIKNINRGRY